MSQEQRTRNGAASAFNPGVGPEAECIGASEELARAIEQAGAQPKIAADADDVASLVDTAMFVRAQGIWPCYHYRRIAGKLAGPEGTLPVAEDDFEALKGEVARRIGRTEADVIYGIAHQWALLAQGVGLDEGRTALLRRAYEIGFRSEKRYRGCAQGLLGALFEVTGLRNDLLFQAATGLSGGIGLCGDGACGGYTGGVMFLSWLRGRSLERIPIDGDKENQYFAYDCAQRLHDRFLACYGSPICRDIHEGMFGGEHFILRTKARRDEFETAGAHTVTCTTVVGLACAWVVEIMLDTGLYPAAE